ncbi:hypothetical protein CLAIMM_14754 isoform 3 [Cladophialophora immunda]|nr:hypothetical protein CLAIMM_14754 isoform 1 [Cladophialophora immunda]OQV10817.1 hypothetical protein CLAIMM_14754 isoform 2 [Cladophialophora immunda]OQV10818.1 hypothetical protein CLAIMM_14754 isoform 3 [Cladophialophora immunda]
MVRRPLEADHPPAESSVLVRTRVQSPRSDSDRSSPRQFTPSSTRSRSQSAGLLEPLEIDPDVPIPSIERESDEASSLSAHNNLSVRARTPSFSITPPVTEGIATPIPSSPSNRWTSPTLSSTVPALTERIGQLELSGEPVRRQTSSSISDGKVSAPSPVDNVTRIMENIRLGTETPRPDTPTPATYLHPRSPSPNVSIDGADRNTRSASRRRSGSYVDPTPHNVTEEEPPQEPFHEPEFQREFANAKNLVSDLVNVLASSSLHHEAQSRIRALYLQAVDLSHFQKPATRTVGLVGDSGVGKSSLLNSLLDFEGFARSYHYHEHENFAIETEYFTVDELHDQFSELLQSYRQYHLRDTQDNDMGEDKEDLKKKARNSHLALLERPGAGAEREFFEEASQCSRRLTELTSEQNSSNEASTWPFIRKIKVYLNAFILSKGLVLVDLPGLRDLNSARLKVTERYLLNCDEIFAVCYIGRATTDASVMGVFDLARRASLSKIGIICTKSEDILAEEAKEDRNGEARTRIENFTSNIDKMKKSLGAIDHEIKEFSIDSDTEAEVDEEESRELVRLHNASRKLKKRIKKEQFELKTFLVNTRNQQVTASLQTIYQQRIPGGNLPVFCISNLDYWEHRKKPKAESMPFLQLSGILQVRKYCLSIVAESQLRAAVSYMTDAIPALLGSVELWVQSGAGSLSAERKQTIRNSIEEIEDALDTLKLPGSSVNATARAMEQQFNTRIVRTMRQYSNDWSEAAQDASMEWQGWNHGTYSAFCRKYGDYNTTAVGRRCWNEEAIQAMVTQLATPWRTLQQDLQASQDDLLDAIDGCFDSVIALSDSTDGTTRSLRTLNRTMRHRQALLLSAVEELEDNFQSDLSILRTDAFSGIRTSFIGQLMEVSYTRTIQEQGTGSDMRRKRIIRDGFGDDRLFDNHRRRFRNRFSDLARDLQDNIQEAIATHLAAIQSDLDTLKNENVALESERHPEFRRRVEEAVRDIRHRMEEAYTVVSRFRTAAA